MRLIRLSLFGLLAVAFAGMATLTAQPGKPKIGLEGVQVAQKDKDAPKEEEQHGRGLIVPKDVKQRHAASWAQHGHVLKALPTVMATSFDCRLMGWVPDLDNQGQCGDCWIFSGADCCGSAFQKAGYGKKVNISKQQLLDCHFRDGCSGGWPEDVAKVAKQYGLVTDDDYGVKYRASPGACKAIDPSKVIKISDYGFCSQTDGVGSYEDFKACMVKFGVISVCYASSGTPSYGENGGVWKGNGSRNVDHAIKAIAFDDSKSTKGAILCWNQWAAGGSDLFWAEWGANELGTSAMWTSAAPLPAPFSVTPATVTLQSGATQQFTASVPATWQATGGTITTTGLFRAGSTAGGFTVTATSQAEPSKTSTAAVTVQAAPIPPIPPGPTPVLSPTAYTIDPAKLTINAGASWIVSGGKLSETTADLCNLSAADQAFVRDLIKRMETKKEELPMRMPEKARPLGWLNRRELFTRS